MDPIRFQKIIPQATNLEIIKLLIMQPWGFAYDYNSKENILDEIFINVFNNINHGFFHQSFHERENEFYKTNKSTELNTYAKLITEIVTEKLGFNKFKIIRFYWNMYFQNSKTLNHTDWDEENYFSILYNLHTTDGGIEIDKKFYKDEMATATVFKSNVLHRGIAPSKDFVRFNLNIILQKK